MSWESCGALLYEDSIARKFGCASRRATHHATYRHCWSPTFSGRQSAVASDDQRISREDRAHRPCERGSSPPARGSSQFNLSPSSEPASPASSKETVRACYHPALTPLSSTSIRTSSYTNVVPVPATTHTPIPNSILLVPCKSRPRSNTSPWLSPPPPFSTRIRLRAKR